MGKLKLYNIMNEVFIEKELQEDYPVNFDLFHFKNLSSYAAKLRYATMNLGKPIGRGSSRQVYRVDNNKVLKLARNKKGIAQNETEIDWSGDGYYDPILARIFDWDRENHYWVEMELAFKPRKIDFQRLWGIRFDNLDFYLMNKDVELKGKRPMWHIDPDIVDQMENSQQVQHLVSFMQDADSPAHDLGRISSWGLVKREDGESLVLVDFGLTSDVYESYYS